MKDIEGNKIIINKIEPYVETPGLFSISFVRFCRYSSQYPIFPPQIFLNFYDLTLRFNICVWSYHAGASELPQAPVLQHEVRLFDLEFIGSEVPEY